MKEKFWTVPNILTVMRIVCVPLLTLAIILDLRWFILTLIVIAGLTDALDGYFARKLNQVSKRGANLDSLADNLFYYSILILVLVFRGNIIVTYLIPIGIVIGLSLTVMTLGYILHKQIIQYHLYIGKASAPFLYYAIIGVLFLSRDTSSIRISFYVSFILMCLGYFEQLILVFIQKKIDLNTPSVLSEIKKRRKRVKLK